MSVFDTPHRRVLPHLEPSRRMFIATGLAGGLTLAVQPPSAEDKQKGSPMEIIVRPNRDVVTLINVFLVEPGNQEKLNEVLKEGNEALFSKQPGYVSTSFHKSKDGRRVVNYGQWRSLHDIEAYRSKPEFGAYLKRVRQLAQFDSMVCDVSYVHLA